MSSKCAIYTRISKEDELDVSLSIQNQVKSLTEYAIECNFEIYRIYVDDGVSGRDFNRSGFQEMLLDLKKNKFEILIVKDLSRLGRNLIKVGEFVEETLPIFKIRLISVLDNYDSKYYANDESIVLRSFVNEYYLKECRKKSLKAIEKVKDTEPILRKGRYGYDLVNGRLVVNPEEAKIIKRIFEQYTSGVSNAEICRGLIADKVYGVGYLRSLKSNFNNPNPDPYFWDARSIIRIIHDEIYIGNHVNNTNSINFDNTTIYGANEPIISIEMFNKAQEICSINKSKQSKTKYAGLFRHKDSNKPLLYKRNGNVSLVCKGFSILVDVVEKVLQKEIDKIFEELIEDPNALLKQIYGDINNYKEKSYSIKNQITTNQGKIKTLFEDYMNGNITSTEYKQFLNQTKKEIENLQIELSKYEALINVTYNEELYKSVVNDFLAKKNVIKDPVILAKVIFKRIYISKKRKKYVFEFEYNV